VRPFHQLKNVIGALCNCWIRDSFPSNRSGQRLKLSSAVVEVKCHCALRTVVAQAAFRAWLGCSGHGVGHGWSLLYDGTTMHIPYFMSV